MNTETTQMQQTGGWSRNAPGAIFTPKDDFLDEVGYEAANPALLAQMCGEPWGDSSMQQAG